MSELNVKVGLIGKFDMLKFKNMSKTREKAIQAAPAGEISGVFPVNENAKALHPDFLELTIDQIRSLCDDLIEAHGDWMPKFN